MKRDLLPDPALQFPDVRRRHKDFISNASAPKLHPILLHPPQFSSDL